MICVVTLWPPCWESAVFCYSGPVRRVAVVPAAIPVIGTAAMSVVLTHPALASHSPPPACHNTHLASKSYQCLISKRTCASVALPPHLPTARRLARPCRETPLHRPAAHPVHSLTSKLHTRHSTAYEAQPVDHHWSMMKCWDSKSSHCIIIFLNSSIFESWPFYNNNATFLYKKKIGAMCVWICSESIFNCSFANHLNSSFQ